MVANLTVGAPWLRITVLSLSSSMFHGFQFALAGFDHLGLHLSYLLIILQLFYVISHILLDINILGY